MSKTALYLRKSRADIEAEARGEGETLAKHKKALLKVAKDLNLNIINVYEEIVSGESLMHRSEMLKLLQDVEMKKFDAVLCMDIDRLGRGGMKEQGLILETFKEAKTKIITPRKTYDLNDEWDEEYSEFEAFMARKELKIITRRMQGGRVRSVESGNYIGTNPPYGYIIKEIKDGRTLEAHPEQSEAVKLIFELYTHDDPSIRVGAAQIANKLNAMNFKTATGKQWANWGVLNILKNPVYCGKVVWKKKEIKKSKDPSKKKVARTRDQSEWIIANGKHEAIISDDLFQKAQEVLKTRYHVPYQVNNKITNPLAGLIECGKCGRKMIYRPYTKQKPHLKCYNNPRCDCKATNFELVEQRLIEFLKGWLQAYKDGLESNKQESDERVNIIDMSKVIIKKLEKEISETEEQINNLMDLLERKLYDEKTYLKRSNVLSKRLDELQLEYDKAKNQMNKSKQEIKAQEIIIPKFENVIDLYQKSEDPGIKNSLIKSVLDKAVYTKEKWQIKDDFKLVVYPKFE
ncbi:recombinase family protein [Neobacillus sp. WH10]|uniref:recombinase family protein n=1 Tax=Neobacillus sp. WH10 TaxID=3047873 RepID=UPI0024C1396C|nr:recombinase family protein [Neobacillus sp. WH10]WHY76267.1 recombinase family protein [Neobacillus sp. WH10]